MTRLLLRAIDFGASAVFMALSVRAFCVHFYKDTQRELRRRRKFSVTIADPSKPLTGTKRRTRAASHRIRWVIAASARVAI